MIGERELVALLHRADWAGLSLSGTLAAAGPIIDGSTTWVSEPPWTPRQAAARTAGPDWYFEAREDGAIATHLLSVAPGQRFRVSSPDGTRAVGCDGERTWDWKLGRRGAADPARAGFSARPQPPFPVLLAPAWLLNGIELLPEEDVTVCGRAAFRVHARPRPGTSRGLPFGRRPVTRALNPMPRWLLGQRWDEIEADVDAELGILLRCTRRARHEAPDVAEFLSLNVGGTTEASFAAPPWSTVAGAAGPWPSGPLATAGKEAARAVAGIAAGGLGALIKYGASRGADPFATATTEDPDPAAAMPADEQAPGEPAAEPPAKDAVLYAMYRSGGVTPRLRAELHQWVDPAALLATVPPTARQAGFGGVGFLIDSVLARWLADPGDGAHTQSTVMMGDWDTYRIDVVRAPQPHSGRAARTGNDQGGPDTIASDGVRQWAVYADRVTTGPAGAVPDDLADLLDASWLLECDLAESAELTVGGRLAYRVEARARPTASWWSRLFLPAVAVVDAQTGWLLRLTTFKGGQPMLRHELRDLADPGPDTDFRFTPPQGLPVTDQQDGPPSRRKPR